jgi:isoquinoline 1-oxidoreductase beta subunit
MNTMDNVSRRTFLQSTAAAGGAVVLGFHLPGVVWGMSDDAAAPPGFKPNAFVRIGKDNVVTVIVGRSEMGQGVLTSLPQIVAEELDADWSKVRWEQSPAHADYNRPGTPIMITGGSFSVRSSWETLRKAGATARAMMVAAAADTWKVDASMLRTDNSAVIGPGGKKLSYGELAEKAATMPVPKDVPLQNPKDFKIVGKSVKRLDTPAKVDGSARFGMDVSVPGMLTAVAIKAPALGAQVSRFNADKAKAAPGVKAVVPISGGVAVVADTYWQARKASELLEIEWGEGTLVGRSSDDLKATLEQAVKLEGIPARREGDVSTAKPERTISATYHLPYLAHACMEPMNCTAWVKPNEVEVWLGTQAQTSVQQNAAAIAGLKLEQVKVHTMFLGGGFGRRAAQDFVNAAVEASKAVGAPVKVIYSREEDMKAAYYRPISYTQISGGVDAAGNAVVVRAKIVVPSLAEASGFKRLIRPDGVDRVAVEGLGDIAYAIPNLQIDWVKHDFGVPIWFWRSVGATHNTFVTETFIDELAVLAGKDPYEFRRALLDKQPRLRAVLELAADKAGWGKPLPKGVGRGIACVEVFGGWTAQVVEASVQDGNPRVHRVVCATDCGRVINPEQVKAQMESSILYALTAALYSEITFKDGKVEQGNFDDYPVVRMNETPKIEVHLVASEENPGGVGEPGTPPTAPALANALYQVTGKRIHTLPLSLQEFKST